MYVDLLVPFFQFFNIFPFDVSFCLFVINCLEVFFNTYMQEFEKIMVKFTSQEATENNKGLNHNIFIFATSRAFKKNIVVHSVDIQITPL